MLLCGLERPARVRQLPRVRLGIPAKHRRKRCDMPQSQVATTLATFATFAATTALAATLAAKATALFKWTLPSAE